MPPIISIVAVYFCCLVCGHKRLLHVESNTEQRRPARRAPGPWRWRRAIPSGERHQPFEFVNVTEDPTLGAVGIVENCGDGSVSGIDKNRESLAKGMREPASAYRRTHTRRQIR